MEGRWLRPSQKGVALIFVHGLLSSSEVAWGSGPRISWPELVVRDPELNDIGVYTFTYNTHLLSGTYSIGDVVDALKEQLSLDCLYDSKALIFVCHSMGGIVVRQFIVDRQLDLNKRGSTIGLFLVASPSLGSRYANLLAAAAKALGHKQAAALRFTEDNVWLNDLDKNFMNLKESRSLPLYGKELTEDKFIVLKALFREKVVPPFSGMRYFGDAIKIPESDHFSICKPKNHGALQHRLLRKFIMEVKHKTLGEKSDATRSEGGALEAPSRSGLIEVGSPKRLFISHCQCNPDRIVAGTIARELAERHQVFTDSDLTIGEHWAERVDAELTAAHYVVVFLSADSVASEIVVGQIEKACELAQGQHGRPILLPVRVAYHEALPYPLCGLLENVKCSYWETDEDTDPVLEQITRAISQGTGLDVRTMTRAAMLTNRTADASNQPLPAVCLKTPGGTMDHQSLLYVRRSSDDLAESMIHQKGFTLIIKGARQTGKSSLLVRVLKAASDNERTTALLDLQLFDKNVAADAFFYQFCSTLTDELNLDTRIADYWTTDLPVKLKCTNYLKRYVIPRAERQILLAIDEADRIADCAFSSEFYSMLRAWHNFRIQPVWKRLDMVLVTSAEPYGLIQHDNESPFNVGEVILLQDLRIEEVRTLNTLYGQPLNHSEVDELQELVHGQPYLTQRGLHLVATGRYTSKELFRNAADDCGPFADHLHYHLFRLYRSNELARTLVEVINNRTSRYDQAISRLEGAGLIRRHESHWVPRCALYLVYFGSRLNA